MTYHIGRIYHGFTLYSMNALQDIHSTGYHFHHEKSGADLVYLVSSDSNKVFSITFRTPPWDNTGIPHILEHSVLCGSRKFPVKEPFVELIKSSLNTFLNALTYPDKTVFPVASMNPKDFMNLMDVYMDAVLYPNIYKIPEIFYQEGWHYHLEKPEDPLTINGVVYNEMLGEFSTAESVLYRRAKQLLFPNSPYAFESGGDPDKIPTLTYEKFLQYHQTYYHPSNSRLFIYGNGDMDTHLAFLNQEYLKDFTAIDPKSEIHVPHSFTHEKEAVDVYSLPADENPSGKSYLSLHYGAGQNLTLQESLERSVLMHYLMNTPGAPLKNALREASLGKDVFGSFESDLRTPYMSLVLKHSYPEKQKDFEFLVRNQLESLCDGKLDRRQLEASLNIIEFKTREADFGSFPTGLVYNQLMMNSWLYERDPFEYLNFENTFKTIRKNINSDHFPYLIESIFLENPHTLKLRLDPEPGLSERKMKVFTESLQKKKELMNPDVLDTIIQTTHKLIERQNTPDKPEDLAKIPKLSRDDIQKSARIFPVEERGWDHGKMLFHPSESKGIQYTYFYFDLSAVPESLLPVAGMLPDLLGQLSTEKRSYIDISNDLLFYTGEFSVQTTAILPVNNPDVFMPKLIVNFRYLSTFTEKALDLVGEILTQTRFDEKKRIHDLIQEMRSDAEVSLVNSGHSFAARQVNAALKHVGKFEETMNGYDFYTWLVDLDDNFESLYETLKQDLESLIKIIFRQETFIPALAAEEEDLKHLTKHLPSIFSQFQSGDFPVHSWELPLNLPNRGFYTPGDVNFVVFGTYLSKETMQYSGKYHILQHILSMDYLWNRIRVQGGAYGVFCTFTRHGRVLFSSYRDPNIRKTLETYRLVPDYLSKFEADDSTMTQLIIGTIARQDIPLSVSQEGEISFHRYLSGLKDRMIQAEREEILSCTAKDIRRYADILKRAVSQGIYCVFGSEKAIKEEKELFTEIIYAVK
ncbi:MAG: insulinase family protein [Candidatus Marinimicrobia bacterium]|nr:insulinase family protein [Candidatus Neomarinimicrobiota bacterium]MDD5582913.1 insulinase family protein [Candidatus Neomarinimicrobiota bacterium]